MLFIRISSLASKEQLFNLSKEHGLLLLDPGKIDSIQSIELAEHLAKNTFKNKTNIAKSFKLEFLLWLAGKMDISRAFELLSFTSNKSILLISSKGNKKKLLEVLRAKELKLNLKEKSDSLVIEKISLSRI